MLKTRERYAFQITWEGALWSQRDFTRKRLRLAFRRVERKCESHLENRRITPRNFNSVTSGMVEPAKERAWGEMLLRQKVMVLVFSVLMESFKLAAHETTLFRSDCRLSGLNSQHDGGWQHHQHKRSSILEWELKEGKLLIRKANKRGPRTEPWGTPLEIGVQDVRWPEEETTRCQRLERKLWINLRTIESQWKLFWRDRRMAEWLARSKALVKSIASIRASECNHWWGRGAVECWVECRLEYWNNHHSQ